MSSNESLFCTRLPTEIRLMIYEYLLSNVFAPGTGRTIHVWKSQQRLLYSSCSSRYFHSRETSRSSIEVESPNSWDTEHRSCRMPSESSSLKFNTEYEPLGFKYTCRLMYEESSAMLYGHIQFSPVGLGATQAFFASTRPDHLNAIKYLEIAWMLHREAPYTDQLLDDEPKMKWNQICQTLAQMQKLKSLVIRICATRGGDLPESAILPQLVEITRPQHLEVYLPESGYPVLQRGELPHQLQRGSFMEYLAWMQDKNYGRWNISRDAIDYCVEVDHDRFGHWIWQIRRYFRVGLAYILERIQQVFNRVCRVETRYQSVTGQVIQQSNKKRLYYKENKLKRKGEKTRFSLFLQDK